MEFFYASKSGHFAHCEPGLLVKLLLKTLPLIVVIILINIGLGLGVGLIVTGLCLGPTRLGLVTAASLTLRA